MISFISCIYILHNSKWKSYEDSNSAAVHQSILEIHDSPNDTFLNYNTKWKSGVTFVNGFNIGRNDIIGPQKTLYIPLRRK